MRIERLKLQDFCQHATIEEEFAPGLNAIRGPNGSGKTNLLNGLVFAVTGDLSRLYGVKTDNIRQPLVPKAKTVAEVILSHGGTKAQITRAFTAKTSSQRLELSGHKEPFTRADEITRELQSLLSVNERLLLDYVFVPQWGIFSFIDQDAGERVKAFGQLFGADKARKLYDMLGDEKIVVPGQTLDATQIKERLAKNNKAADDGQLVLNLLVDVPEVWDQANDPNFKLVQLAKRQTELQSQLKETTNHLDLLRRDIPAKTQKCSELSTELEELAETLKNVSATVAQAQSDLKSWELYGKVAQLSTTKQKELDTRIKELNSLVAPPPETDMQASLEARKRALVDSSFRLKSYQTYIKNISENKEAQCPFCGTPGRDLADHKHNYLEMAELEAVAVRELTVSVAESEAHATAVTAFEKRTKELAGLIDGLRHDLVELTPIKPQTDDPETLKTLVAEFTTLTNTFNAKTKSRSTALTELSRLEGQADTQVKHCEYLKTVLATVFVATGEAERAQQELQAMSQRVARKQWTLNSQKVLEQQIKDDEALLLKCQEEEKSAEAVKHLAEHISEVRDVMKDLPRIASQYHLESMQREINEVLELFSAPFRVQAIDNLRFTLRFHNGKIMPAERLSGGQRVVFALAFRIVINSRWARELGLLCLDEPTAGLDEDNLACLGVALGRLRELSKARGLQVILITHDPGLDGFFDRVIKLPAAS